MEDSAHVVSGTAGRHRSGGRKGRRKNQQSETQKFPSGQSSFVFDGTVISSSTGRIRNHFSSCLGLFLTKDRPLLVFLGKGDKEDEVRGSVVAALVWRRADDSTVVQSVTIKSDISAADVLMCHGEEICLLGLN